MTPRKHAKHDIVYRPVDQLELDENNPRLTADMGKDPEKLLAWMLRNEAIDELALSIAQHGYFSEEPLVTVPHETHQDRFVVVEGNRRLSALKLLLNPALAAKLGAVNWPALTPDRAEEISEVPTVNYDTRDEVVPYLGFRHITGVKTWDPYAKARYIAQLIDTGRQIADIEQGIGDSAGTVKKLYQSLVVYNQAIEDLQHPAKDLRNSFSLLELTLSQQPIKRFLGLPRELPKQKVDRVVDDKHLPALGEVLSWVFGNSDAGTLKVITDSRQITGKLAPVIASAESLDYLRQHRDLEGAYERSGGERAFFLKSITSAHRSAQRALGVAPQFRGDAEALTETAKLKQTVDALEKLLQ